MLQTTTNTVESSPINYLDVAHKFAYLELMSVPEKYSFRDIREVFSYISKKYHRYNNSTLQKDSFFESVYYALVTEAYDYLKDTLKQQKKELQDPCDVQTRVNFQDMNYLHKFTQNEALILAKLKELYINLCVKDPTKIIDKQDLKKEYLLYSVNKQKNYSGLKKMYQDVYHNSQLEETYLLDKISNTHNKITLNEFKEKMGEKENAFFRINLSLIDIISVLEQKAPYYSRTINYEYKSMVSKDFLCSDCTNRRAQFCKICNNTGTYKKLVETRLCNSLDLKITKNQILAGFLIRSEKGHIFGPKRGLLLLQLDLGLKKHKEMVVIKENTIRIIKSLSLEYFNRMLHTKEDLELAIHELNHIATIPRSDVLKIPMVKDITKDMGPEIKDLKLMSCKLILVLHIPY